MNKNNTEILLFEDLLDNAGFVKPVFKEDIKNAGKSKRILLKKILRETGQWTILFGLLFGLIDIIKKAKIILLANKIISVSITLSLSIGSYYTIKYLTYRDAEVKSSISDLSESEKLKEDIITEKNTSLAEKNEIEFQLFTSTSVDKSTLGIINSELLKGLKTINKNRIKESNNESDAETKYIILGHVEDIEKSLHIYIKIIDKETSEVIFVLNKGMHKDNMVEECRTISKELSLNFLKQDPRK